MVEKLAINGGSKTVPEGLAKPQPWVTDEERKSVIKAVDTPRPQTFEIVKEAEAEWTRYTGVKHCLMTNSGTTALHIAIAATEVGPGEEVITSAFTWHASALCVVHHNGVPVFIDIDPKTLNLDPKKIEEKITDRTKAIEPVHLHGLPADMDEINAIAKKYGLVVIEDVSHAHGAEYKGNKAGALGDMGGASLQSNKVITSHGGGIFTTNSDEYMEKARAIRDRYAHLMSPLAAAFVIGQIRNMDRNLEIRRRNCEYLTRHLRKIDGVKPIEVPADRRSAYWLYPIIFKPEEVDIKIAPRKFRMAAEQALVAEGAGVGQWQRTPTHSFDYLKSKNAYGKGCPWSCPFYTARIEPFYTPLEYRDTDYPETLRALEVYSTVRDFWPPNGIELMAYYVDAFEKVFDNLDAVIEIADKIMD